MSVLITLQIGPVDWDRFQAALEWLDAQAAPGCVRSTVYRSIKDPAQVLIVDEWTTREAAIEFASRVDPEFNARAGTEALSWQDASWELPAVYSRSP